MNKKFSTLVASLLLATTVGTVTGTEVKVPVTDISNVSAVVTGTNAYQLIWQTSGKVLVMEQDEKGSVYLKVANPYDGSADLLASMWEITSTTNEEGGVSYTFMNKKYGLPLAFSSKEDKSTVAMGDVILWKWRADKNGKDYAELSSFISETEKLVLGVNGDGYVYAEKSGANAGSMPFDARVAKEVILNADHLNSLLGTKALPTDKLAQLFAFNPNATGKENLWLKDLMAENAIAPSESNDQNGHSTKYYTEEQVAEAKAIAAAVKKYVEETALQDASKEVLAIEADDATLINDYASKILAAETIGGIDSEVSRDVKNADTDASDSKEISDFLSWLNEEAGKSITSDAKATAKTFEQFEKNIKDSYYPVPDKPDNIKVGSGYIFKTQAEDILDVILKGFTSETYTLEEAQAYVDGIVSYVEETAKLLPTTDVTKDNYLDKIKAAILGHKSDDSELSLDVQMQLNNAIVNLGDNNPQWYVSNASLHSSCLQQWIKEIGKTVEGFEDKYLAADVDGYKTVLESIAKDNEKEVPASVNFSSITGDNLEAWNASLKELSDKATATYKSASAKAETLGEISKILAKYNDPAKVVAIVGSGTDVKNYLKGFASNALTADYAAKSVVSQAEYIKLGNYYQGEAEASDVWVSLYAGKDAKGNKTYLHVDTNFVTSKAGVKHLAFAIGTYNSTLKNSNKADVEKEVQKDYNRRYNFRFIYFPTNDSLDITTDGYAHKLSNGTAYVDMTNEDLISSKLKHFDERTVKLAVLADNHTEATIGAPELVEGTENYTINTRISMNLNAGWEKTTLKSGVYFFNLVTADPAKRTDNGKYVVRSYYNGVKAYEAPENSQNFNTIQNFEHMPRTQWVVEQNEGVEGKQTINITNREFGNTLSGVQLYKAGDNVFAYVNGIQDTVSVKAVSDEAKADKYLGYRTLSKAEYDGKIYNLDYLSGIELGNYVNVAEDSTVYVDLQDNKSYVEFVPVTSDTKYGYASEKAGAAQMYVNAYNLRVYNSDLMSDATYYIVKGEDDNYVISNTSKSGETPLTFALKENNEVAFEDGDTCYYVLQEVTTYTSNNKKYVTLWTNYEGREDGETRVTPYTINRVGVHDGSMVFSQENDNSENRKAAFALIADPTRFYRELTTEELSNNNLIKFYRVDSNNEYLYEGEGSLLAVEGKGDNVGDLANMTVIPTTEPGVLMPQYLIARNVVVKEGYIDWCSEEEHANRADSLACPHTKVVNDSIIGEFLVNTRINGDLHKSTLWNDKYTRLAFVKGVAVRDITNDDATYTTLTLGTDADADAYGTVTLNQNKHNAAKFEFRLINDEEAQDFLIESESWNNNNPFNGGTRPMTEGGWVKIQNGVPVIVADDFEAAKQSDIFNIEGGNNDPTANDEISTSEVTVITGNGQITINGAAGKKVVVSNILGQVVANTVLTSDNATIAAPQGVVVVAVEGEEAVKAIVK